MDAATSVYAFLLKGGWLVWPILLCSVMGLGIFLERLFYIARLRRADSQLLGQVATHDTKKGMERLLCHLRGAHGPLSHMLLDAASLASQDIKAVETVLDHHMDVQVGIASRHLDFMATLAAVSPLLGLLGTVTGLIRAFMVIERAGGQVNAALLAGGIWEAMLTTALGLGVAIVLIIGHRFLISRIKMLEEDLQRAAFLFLKAMWGKDKVEVEVQ